MTVTVELSPLSREDSDDILRIETTSFPQPWGRQAILDELAVVDAIRIAARSLPTPQAASVLVGFIFARIMYEEMHVMKIATDPGWRHRGVASALLEAAQAEACRRGAIAALLEVRPTNTAAIGFYRKAGFETIGVRPNYYPQTRENALVMSKPLKEVS